MSLKKPIVLSDDEKLHRLAKDEDTAAGIEQETYPPSAIPISGDLKMLDDGLYFTLCDCPDCAIRVFSSYQYPLIMRDGYQANMALVEGMTLVTTTIDLVPTPDAIQAGQVIPTGGRVQPLLTDHEQPPEAIQGGQVIPTGGRVQSLLMDHEQPPEAIQGGQVIPTGGRLWADLVRYWHPTEDGYKSNHVKVDSMIMRS